MQAEAGVVRRVRVQHYTSRFLTNIIKDDYQKHEYVRIKEYENRFQKAEYKNAYLHLLLDHIDDLKVPASAQLAFEDIAADYDEFTHLLEQQYELTLNEEDEISRHGLESYFEEHKWKWTRALSELKRLGVIYKRDRQIQGKRGVVYGLKEREEMDYSSD